MLLEKVAFFLQFGLAVFHIANVVKIKFYSFFFSFFSGSILCLNSKCKCLKISEINPYLLSIFQRNSLAINKIHGIVCIVNGSDDDTARKTKKPTTEAKMILTMKAEREGYAPDQIARTMTVGELIEFLNNFDEDEKIYLSHDNGYTYGGITAYRFEEVEEETENE